MAGTITVNGEAYSAEKIPGTLVWIVKWFTSTHSSVPNNILAGQTAEAEVDECECCLPWTDSDAVKAAIKRGSWA
jgi:hypothetical protein